MVRYGYDDLWLPPLVTRNLERFCGDLDQWQGPDWISDRLSKDVFSVYQRIWIRWKKHLGFDSRNIQG